MWQKFVVCAVLAFYLVNCQPENNTASLPLSTTISTRGGVEEIFEVDSTEPVILNSTHATVTDVPINLTFTTIKPIDTTTKNPVQIYSQSEPCSCDLLVKECDVNCCCDPNCSQSDFTYFTTDCNQTSISPLRSDSCIDENLLYRKNSDLLTYRQTPGLICLVYDNNPQRLLFDDRSVITNISDFDSHRCTSDFCEPVTRISTEDAEIQRIASRDPRTFKVGDPVFMLMEPQRVAKKLRLPAASGLSQFCASMEDIRFLDNKESVCAQKITNLSSDCTSLFAFNAAHFFPISILASPEAFVLANLTVGSLTDFAPFANDDLKNLVIPLRINSISTDFGDQRIVEFDTSSSLSSRAPVFWPENQTCSNALSGLGYVITHNGSTIITVALDIFLSSISFTQRSFPQTFTVRYISLGFSQAEASRSGNPGYLDGKPILVAQVPTSSPTQLVNISISSLVLPMLDSAGVCRTDITQNVLFGESVQMSCIVYLNISSNAAACANLRGEILQLLASSGVLPNYVSSFGNGTVFSVESFVPVLRKISSETTVFVEPNICKNLITGLNIEIAYANVGLLNAPQRKITGLLFRYSDPRDVIFECPFYGCTRGTLMPMEIQFSVSFFDFSKPPVDARSLQPGISRFLPYDFFAPF